MLQLFPHEMFPQQLTHPRKILLILYDNLVIEIENSIEDP